MPLLRAGPGIDQLVAHGAPLPDFDVQVPLMSLPGVFRTTLTTVPADVPYLSTDPALVERWQCKLEGTAAFKVGIAWQGNPSFPGDRLRSVPLAHFAPLARVEGVTLFGLHKGSGREQIPGAARQVPLIDLGERLDEASGAFMDTAAVVKNLDLVVTSDTAVAHLAGALGVPVWVALPVGPDWRWLIDREDCPWYPTMRLFRQRRLHDWEEMFERMAAELRRKQAPAPRKPVVVPVSPGEMIDKITILEVKAQRISDSLKLRNVRVELAALQEVQARSLPFSPELEQLTAQLRQVNAELWQIEDDIRMCERDRDFGARFIGLARSVYHTNDRRSALKRRLNTLLDSGSVEEKAYAPYATADSNRDPPRPRATVCILTYGDYLPYFRRCLDSVLQNTPVNEIELRLGFNAASASLEYARERLGLTDGAATIHLSESVRRISSVCPSGMAVRLWESTLNHYKEPMARLMYHDIPLTTEYAVWFDDDTFVERGWWPALCSVLDRSIDYIGKAWWVDYLPGQEEMIRAQPWFHGKSFETREGRSGVRFMTGGFLAIRAECLREANFPDTDFRWQNDTLKQYGGDTLLGEIARQLGWTQAIHDECIKVNVDLEGRHPAPRRGGTGRQFGSEIDVAIA